jgi:hypothetical protein
MAKGKDSAASHFPRAEVEERYSPDSRITHGPCAIGLESTRFEKSQKQRTNHMDWTNGSDTPEPRSKHLVNIDRCIKPLRHNSWAIKIER